MALIHGGVGYGNQREELKRGIDVLVATPGRLIDHLEQGTMTLKDINILVLDEVDRMLDMGFLPQVRRVVEQCPKERQTLFFSATIPPEIESLTKWVLRDPEIISIGAHHSPADTITHAFYPVARDQKFDLLLALLERTNFDSVLIFSRTKHGADKIASRLKAANHSVAVLYPNRTQNERVEALEGFKSGKYEAMVATDIAARRYRRGGGRSYVVNYDVPQVSRGLCVPHRPHGSRRKGGGGCVLHWSPVMETRRCPAIKRLNISTKVPCLKLDNFLLPVHSVI